MVQAKFKIPEFDTVMCFTADTGEIWGIPLESGNTYTELTGSEDEETGSWAPTGAGTLGDKLIVRCVNATELEFEEVSMAGKGTSGSPTITALLAPYISTTKRGGYYIAEWFPAYESWVITAGQCPEEVADYEAVDGTTDVVHHVRLNNGNVVGSAISGHISLSNSLDDYSRLESSQLEEVYPLYGYNGSNTDVFHTDPTFTLDKDNNRINFEGIVLNPGAAGLAVYNFIVSRCNGENREHIRWAFRCVEDNTAPTVTLEETSVEVHTNESLSNHRIGTATDDDSDPLTVDSNVISGAHLLNSHSITVDDGVLYLNVSAKNNVVGTAIIEFRLDDAHNYKADKGVYERHTLIVNVVNHVPEVTLRDSVFRLNRKHGKTQTIVVGTVQDEDDDTQFSLSDDMYIEDPNNTIDDMSIEINDSTVSATITTSDTSAGPSLVFFKVHDEHRVYSDMAEPVYNSFYVISENEPPKVNLTRPKIEIRGLEEQEFNIATISDPDGDDEFLVKITKVEGPKCYDSVKLDLNGNSLKLTIRPSKKESGTIYVHFKVDDVRGHYTKGEPQEMYVQVLCGNTPPTFNQTLKYIVIRNGQTVTKTLGTLSDSDGDEEFSPVVKIKNESFNEETQTEYFDVATGQIFVDEDTVKCTLTGREGCIGEERFVFYFDDVRGNYDRGEQEEYELIVRVI